MPVDARHRGSRESVVLRTEYRVAPAVGRELDLAGPDRVDRACRDRGTQGFGQLLGAQADTQYRKVGVDRRPDQRTLTGQPRKGVRVVDAHRSAHDHQAAHVVDRREPGTQIESDHDDGNAVFGQHAGDRTGALVGDVLQDRPGASRPIGVRPGH